MKVLDLKNINAEDLKQAIIDEYSRINRSGDAEGVACYAAAWKKTKNPCHIDIAMGICEDRGLEILPTLQKCLNEASKQRLDSGQTGSLHQIRKKRAKNFALRYMLNCTYSGDSEEIAASKAASFTYECFPDIDLYKTTTLRRYYRDIIRKPAEDGTTIEQLHFSSLDKLEDTDKTALNKLVKRASLSGEK